jgi:hypothetical protein
VPPVPVDLKELAPPERIQVRGEVLTCWKTVSVEKDGNYPDPAFETCANLVTKEIFLVLKTRLALPIRDRLPRWPNERQQYVAGGQSSVECLLIILARFDRLEIEEYGVGPEALDERIAQPSGLRARVVTSVADEERGRDAAELRLPEPSVNCDLRVLIIGGMVTRRDRYP